MITMEFEEMKNVWDTQNNEPLYGINEKALHNRILSEKKKAFHITNISEVISIIAYAVSGGFIIPFNLGKQGNNIFMYMLAAWMLASALCLLVSRLRRLNGVKLFDRSIRGDLTHAISVARYQVRISRLLRWNILPIGVLTMLVVWESGKSLWVLLGILVFFVLTIYASGWEHAIYKKKIPGLEKLKEKLETEDLGEALQ
jgi:hypothetical protein